MTRTVTAPRGDVSITISLVDGIPRFEVLRGHVSVLTGRLGLVTDDADLSTALVWGHVDEQEVRCSFSLPHGKRRAASAVGNEVAVTLEAGGGARLVVVARAFDDGVAFRYHLPEPARRTFVEEATTFEFVDAGRAWIQPTDVPDYTQPAYEAVHVNGGPIGQAPPGPSWNLPALFETAGTWVMLTESDTDGHYFGGHISSLDDERGYRWTAPQSGEGDGVGDVAPTHDSPWTLPWRVLAIGDLDRVVESDLVRLLAGPGQEPAEWIRPGRVSWSWWSDHDSPQNLDALRDFIDLAAEMGWEYSLIDANWNLHDESDIRALIDHATSVEVGVFLWYNSGGPNNHVTEQPRDRMFDHEVRRAEFARLAEWGVVGVKVDFWQSDKAESNERYLALAEDAYDAGLMVNYHGCTIPRGWEVRFPNIMTMEAVRGAEQYGFEPSFTDDAPWLNTILALTRNVVGSMDYTPVTFSDIAHPHTTTNAHELALAVVFESALGHFADSATSYRSQPEAVRAFLRDVPVAWDETRLLSGEPGDHVVLARRDGSQWWVGGINGTAEARTLELDLGRIGPGRFTLFGDGDDDRTIEVTDIDVDGPFTVTMSGRGGFSLAPGSGDDS